MFKKITYFVFILTSFFSINSAHAETQTSSIPLTRLDKSKACDLTASLKFETNDDDVQNFKIENNQKVKVSLINKSNTLCYQFDYEPSYSPMLIYKITKKKLTITEMIGTFENGHQLENTYKIQTRPLSLVFSKAKFIDYIRYENPKTKQSEVRKVISNY